MNKEAIRFAYGEELVRLGGEMPELVVLDADVSHSTQSCMFAKAYPDRFYNVGISETNMVCMAAGMAEAGLLPVANTFGFLLCEHCLDQIRASVAYPCMNVKLAGNYGGLSDSYDGASHHTIDDIAVLRALPNMKIVVLSDAAQTRSALKPILLEDGPVYFRLCRAPTSVFHEEGERFVIGQAVEHLKGTDALLVATGIPTWHAIGAAKALHARGMSVGVMEMPTVKPLDERALLRAAAAAGLVITVEEGNILGGLGSAVAETLSEHLPVRVKRLGIHDRYTPSGPYDALLKENGLSVEEIARQTEFLIREKAMR